MAHTEHINNWDLVDASSEFIVGPYLEYRPEKIAVLSRFAASESLWERRIAILATFAYIKRAEQTRRSLLSGSSSATNMI